MTRTLEKETTEVPEANAQLRQGDALEVLRTLPAKRFQCCVTSPPYFQQRDYGAGGLGLESSVVSFVGALTNIFTEVRRVLRDDGTCWLNLGDTYNAYNGNRGPSTGKANKKHHAMMPTHPPGHGLTDPSFPNKCLMQVPHRVASSLVASGWILRADVIWVKTSPMPERVTDRPRRAHEHLFLFSKKDRYRAECAGTDVWEIPTGQGQARGHTAPFPDELVRRVLGFATLPGDEVLDPFVGSGTTVRVAKEMGRSALGIDRKAWWLP